MPRLRLAPAAAALALATACTEDPSFVLRWQVGRSPEEADEAARQSVRQCSELGISRVRVITSELDGTEVDTREFACFPEVFADDGAAPGPEVGPGDYFVTVVGLTRQGVARPDPEDPTDDEKTFARDKRKVTVRSTGEGALVDEFRLIGVGECGDGIDNDRDGAVDDGDLACRQGELVEGLDTSATIFTFQATLLGGTNPIATCTGLGIDSLRVTLDDDASTAQTIECTTVPQSFSAYLDPGEHTWSVVGLDDGAVVTKEITGESSSFTVVERGYNVVDIAIDLSFSELLAPIVESLAFSVDYERYPGGPTRACPLTGGQDIGVLALGPLQIRLLDERGEEVPMADLVDAKMTEDASFPVADTCPAFDRTRRTVDMTWADADGQRGYFVEVRTWAEGDDPATAAPCFSNAAVDDPALAPAPLAPGLSLTVTVPRLRSDGSCADCTAKAMDEQPDCTRCDEAVGICRE